MLEIFVLAAASAIWPTLFAVVLAAIRAARPALLLASFLAGALLTTVTVGAVIVFALHGTSSFDRGSAAGPIVDLVVGLLAIVVAHLVVARSPRRQPDNRPERSSWSERMLARGALLAFVAGIVLDIVPGFLPFVALKDIAQLGYDTFATLALIVGFYLVMFTPVEIPLLGYLIRPERTAVLVDRVNRWLARDGRRILALCLDAIGIFLIVRGAIRLAR